MRPHYVAVILGVLFVLSALSPASMAAPEDEEIPMLRVFFEKDTYAVGEQVNVSAEVTANGRFVNPDLPGVSMAILMNFTFGEGGPGDIQWISLTSVDKGKFNGDFIIEDHHIVKLLPQEEGLPLMGQVVFTMAICSYQTIQASAMAMAEVESGPVINMAVSNHYPSPGDTVTITVTTSNGTMVDAASVVVGLTSYDGENEVDLADLTVIRESTGVYKAQYTIPVDLTRSTLYTVNAGASFLDYNASVYLEPLFGTGFMVSFFDVWYQNVSSDGDVTTIAAWVADLDGSALEGIDLDMDVMKVSTSGTDTETLSGTTDSNGRAEFVIDHTGADRLDIDGAVTDGVRTQSFYFEGMVDNSVPEPPLPDDGDSSFSVVPWETSESGPIWDMIKEPGDPVHVQYRVFNSTGVVPNKRVNWYLIDRDGFFDTNWTTIDSGFEVTDNNGDLDLTFQVPENDVNGWLLFEANIWNPEGDPVPALERMESSEPLIDAGFFSRNENIDITIGRFHKDNPVELRATVPLPESYYIGQFFAVFDEDTGLTQWGQPQALGPMSDDFNIMPLPKMGPDTFGMDKQLPEFFPEDQSIAFMVLSVDLEAFKIEMNYVMMGYGESSTKGVDVSQPNEPDPIHPDSEGTLEFEVENTGAGTDRYTVEQMTGSEWLTWDNETISIEPSESGTFTATVVVPPGVNENRYYFNVTVTSETDPLVTKSIELWVDVMVNGVEVTVTDDEKTANREDSVEFIATIKNTGQGNDTFTISLEGDAAAWATPSHTTVTLQEDGESEIIVQVAVPDDADEDSYTIMITATSEDGVTNASAEMTVNVMVDGVEVEASTDLEDAWRQVTVSIYFNVTNTGQGSDTFTLTVEADEPSWYDLSDTTITVAEGETESVLMEVTPSDEADAGFYEFILTATSGNEVTNATAATSVHVKVPGVHLAAKKNSMTGYRGEQLQFDFELTNTGQEREVFTLTHENSEWAESIIFGANPVALDPEAMGEVSATVMLSDTIDQGIYKFNVIATSSDAKASSSNELTVTVTVNGLDISIEVESITLTKGKEKEIELTITNTGQGSDTFNILLTGVASNWSKVVPTVVTLGEGLSETVTITISPEEDTKGDHAFLDITVVSSDPFFNEKVQVQVVLEEAEDSGGLSSTIIIAIVVILIIIVALVVYMMQSKSD